MKVTKTNSSQTVKTGGEPPEERWWTAGDLSLTEEDKGYLGVPCRPSSIVWWRPACCPWRCRSSQSRCPRSPPLPWTQWWGCLGGLVQGETGCVLGNGQAERKESCKPTLHPRGSWVLRARLWNHHVQPDGVGGVSLSWCSRLTGWTTTSSSFCFQCLSN